MRIFAAASLAAGMASAAHRVVDSGTCCGSSQYKWGVSGEHKSDCALEPANTAECQEIAVKVDGPGTTVQEMNGDWQTGTCFRKSDGVWNYNTANTPKACASDKVCYCRPLGYRMVTTGTCCHSSGRYADGDKDRWECDLEPANRADCEALARRREPGVTVQEVNGDTVTGTCFRQSNGQWKYNTANTPNSCTSDNQCLCLPEPVVTPSPTPPPTDAPEPTPAPKRTPTPGPAPYRMIESGTCCGLSQYRWGVNGEYKSDCDKEPSNTAQCTELAEKVDGSGTSVQEMNGDWQTGTCFKTDGNWFYNTANTPKPCSSTKKCLCKTVADPAFAGDGSCGNFEDYKITCLEINGDKKLKAGKSKNFKKKCVGSGCKYSKKDGCIHRPQTKAKVKCSKIPNENLCSCMGCTAKTKGKKKKFRCSGAKGWKKMWKPEN